MRNDYGREVLSSDYARGYADARNRRLPVSPLVLAYERGYMAGYDDTSPNEQIRQAVWRMWHGKSALAYERKTRRL